MGAEVGAGIAARYDQYLEARIAELEAHLAAAKSALAAVREVHDAAIEVALGKARERLR